MKKLLIASAAIIGLFALTAPAHSATVTYGLDFEFSTGDSPVGTPPWVTVTFTDVAPGAVDLTINTDGLTPDEFMDDLYINFDPLLDVALLDFAAAPGNDAIANNIFTQDDNFKADGAGFFDILLDYGPPPGNGDELFEADETVVYNITSTEAITIASFQFLSTEGTPNGEYHAAAHIQRIGDNAEGSGWIGDTNGNGVIPEPATMLLFGIGITGLTGFARRRKK